MAYFGEQKVLFRFAFLKNFCWNLEFFCKWSILKYLSFYWSLRESFLYKDITPGLVGFFVLFYFALFLMKFCGHKIELVWQSDQRRTSNGIGRSGVLMWALLSPSPDLTVQLIETLHVPVDHVYSFKSLKIVQKTLVDKFLPLDPHNQSISCLMIWNWKSFCLTVEWSGWIWNKKSIISFDHCLSPFKEKLLKLWNTWIFSFQLLHRFERTAVSLLYFSNM